MIVVDLGCGDPEGTAWSVGILARELDPDHIYGFDPINTLPVDLDQISGVPCTLTRSAAWLWNGHVGYTPDGSSSRVDMNATSRVRCFDFARWVMRLPQPVTVKMDIEGAEYALIDRMVELGADKHISELLVEWHTPRLGCKVTAWQN